MINSSLRDMNVGVLGYISALRAEGSMRRRLLDLGFVPGTQTECLYCAPSGDPRAYLIRGTIIALRNDDAALIEI